MEGLPQYRDDEVLGMEDPSVVKLLRGWLQSDFSEGCRRYRYTGWQWGVALAQRPLESLPVFQSATERLNRILPEDRPMNHVIGTVYGDSKDCIGFHSDKPQDFASKSGFIVMKLGATRRFQFGILGNDNRAVKVFFDKPLPAGTAVIVGEDANLLTVHGVPEDPACLGPSGSIVWRNIKTLIPWETVKKTVTKTKKESKKSKEDEEEDNEEAEENEQETKEKKKRSREADE